MPKGIKSGLTSQLAYPVTMVCKMVCNIAPSQSSQPESLEWEGEVEVGSVSTSRTIPSFPKDTVISKYCRYFPTLSLSYSFLIDLHRSRRYSIGSIKQLSEKLVVPAGTYRILYFVASLPPCIIH